MEQIRRGITLANMLRRPAENMHHLSHGSFSKIRVRRHNQVVHTLPTQWKPEKWYYLETSSNGLKNFLKCRTVGLCMTHNRLLNYHVVRSTKPVHFIFPIFIAARDRCMPREETHLAKYPLYPDGRRTQAALLLTLRRYDATIAEGAICICVHNLPFLPLGSTILLVSYVALLFQACTSTPSPP